MLNNQQLGMAMQILHKDQLQSLRYGQHTYTIMGTIDKIVRKSFQHVFINNNHCILIKINTFALDSHCKIYYSKIPLTKILFNDIIQLFSKLTNVEQLLYKYANVMQQIDSSSCALFTISYATNITFGIDTKKSKNILSQMRLHFRNNINNKHIDPFPKYPNQQQQQQC
jgi:hypothetical protein